MNRIAGLILACLTFFLSSAGVQAQDVRPNIVVFLVDDMGVMDTSVSIT